MHNGDTGDPACEHYYRWREDLDLMSHSASLLPVLDLLAADPAGWARAGESEGARLLPALLEGLHERGISPLVTLYHWDLPQALEDEGGWASRDTAERFAEYAELVFDGLGDLVQDWTTHNEPWVIAFLGYAFGTKAPGATDGPEPSARRTTCSSRTARSSAPSGRQAGTVGSGSP